MKCAGKSSVLLLLLPYALACVFCPNGMKAADNISSTDTILHSRHPLVEVLEVVFINNSYCPHEDFNSKNVFSEIFSFVSLLNSSQLGNTKLIIKLHAVDVHATGFNRLQENVSNHFVLIHPGCTKGVQYLAERRSLVNMTLFTYAFSDLNMRSLTYPNHFRMIPGEGHLATAVGGILYSFKWKRVVIFTQDIPVFTAVLSQITTILNPLKVTITNITMLDATVNGEAVVSFPRDNRIFVLNVYPAQASVILCQAYHLDMKYPDYVWITYGWYPSEWWIDSYFIAMVNCTAAELESMLVGSISVSHYHHHSNLNQSLNGSTIYTKMAMDSLSTMIKAINDSAGTTSNVNGALSDIIKDINFIGKSGPVSFENQTNMRAVHQIAVFQYRIIGEGLSIFIIGHINDNNLSLILDDGIEIEDIWQGRVPADGTPITVLNYPLLSLMAVCYLLATAGILFAAVCLIFNIAFRKKRLIRLTSPTINYVIILGAILFYSSVYTFFYVPGTTSSSIVIECNFRLWLTSVGFSVCYVPINVKMWRVYHISRKPSLKKAVVKDMHLLIIILMVVMFDILLLGLVTSFHSSRYSVILIPDKENPGTFVDEDDLSGSFEVIRCHSATEPYWLTVVFGYKFMMQAVGVFLAFSIRKVKIKGLNDSREVSHYSLPYKSDIGYGVLVTLTLGEYINVDAGVYGLGISSATTVVLGFIFIPKMYGLYKDPEGKDIFVPSISYCNSGTLKSSSGNQSGFKNITKDQFISVVMDVEVLEDGLVSKEITKVPESASSEFAQAEEMSKSD